MTVKVIEVDEDATAYRRQMERVHAIVGYDALPFDLWVGQDQNGEITLFTRPADAELELAVLTAP